MKLILESKEFRSKLNNSLVNSLDIPNVKQLAEPHDPKLIIWNNLIIPLDIKLNHEIDTPIKNQLYNTHI